MKPKQHAIDNFYNNIAKTYDNSCFSYLYQTSCEICCQHVQAHCKLSSPHILDMAVGTGNALSALSALYPNAHLIGNDTSPGMLAVARKKLKDNLQTLCVDAQNITQHVAPNSQDLILCHYLFSYVDTDTLLKVMYQTLKPGGYLSIATTTQTNCRNFEHPFMKFLDRQVNPLKIIQETGVPASHDALKAHVLQHHFSLITDKHWQPDIIISTFSDLKNWASDSGWLASYLHHNKWIKLLMGGSVIWFSKCFIPGLFPLTLKGDTSFLLLQKPVEEQ